MVYDGLRSPTEYESTPLIAHVLQEYFLRLVGTYRDFIQPEGAAANGAAAKLDGNAAQESPSEGRSLGDIRAQPSFRQSPRAQTGRAEDDGCLRWVSSCLGHAIAICCSGCNQPAAVLHALLKPCPALDYFNLPRRGQLRSLASNQVHVKHGAKQYKKLTPA